MLKPKRQSCHNNNCFFSDLQILENRWASPKTKVDVCYMQTFAAFKEHLSYSQAKS